MRAYDDLHVKHEQLTLITPQFETPLPPLHPAVRVFSLALMSRCSPQHSASPRALHLISSILTIAFPPSESVWHNLLTNVSLQLSVLTAGNEDDLEYFVRECGEIFGIKPKTEAGTFNAKHVLEVVLREVCGCIWLCLTRKIANFKKINQDAK